MADPLDQLLAQYCAPTFAGIKPASLVACDRERFPDLPRRLAQYQQGFAPRGIRFEIICACRGRFLLLVYQEERLRRRLQEARVQRVLGRFGYPAGESTGQMLRRLRGRMLQQGGFPHEIGLFLGYEPEDVVGFVRYAGRGCKLSGYWKVYGDAEAASRLFERMSRVCRAVTRRVEQGESLLQVFAAA